MAYELFDWPGLPGRGEFVRLALEDAGADYVDVARGRGPGRGVPALLNLLKDNSFYGTPFAPPFLRDGELLISHVANILLYLGPRLGLAPQGEGLRHFANGLQLTISDFLAEAHDTHHPIATGLYYEDQKEAAKERTIAFLAERVPKYLGYFERTLASNPAGAAHAVGGDVSYVDLSLFQLWEGLRYAFPRATAKLPAAYPHLSALAKAVAKRPRLIAYLASPRRLAFNESGIFRHYPELDQDPD